MTFHSSKIIFFWLLCLCHGGHAFLSSTLTTRPFMVTRQEIQSSSSTIATELQASTSDMSRSHVIRQGLLVTASLLFTATPAAVMAIPPQKSYSQNAKNMDRLSAGDASGGSVYDNNPSQPNARKRRAMQGCKIDSARDEAANALGLKKLSEKDCNMQVMSESPDFMLTALQTLDCPTCPYGVRQ